MIGGIISGVASVLGGLLGGSESSKFKKKGVTRSKSTNDTNLKKMVREAERAGFNPLTVLQAGGLAAYGKTTSVSRSKEKGSGSSQSSSPLGAGIAAAGAAIGGAMDSGPSQLALNSASAWQGIAPSAAAANQREYDALQAQLKAVQPGDLGTQPRVPVSAVHKAATPALASGGEGAPIKPSFEVPQATNPFGVDTGVKIAPIPDADAWETRYSEPGGYVGGVYTALKDWEANNYGLDQLKQGWRDSAPVRERNAKYLGELFDQVRGGGHVTNVWDPPAITMGLPPVVQQKPVPDLYKDPFPAWQW